MPTPYPTETHRRAIALVQSGQSIAAVAAQLHVSKSAVHGWVTQDEVDRGLRPGVPSADRSELLAAWRRIHALEAELEALKGATAEQP